MNLAVLIVVPLAAPIVAEVIATSFVLGAGATAVAVPWFHHRRIRNQNKNP